MGIQITNLNKAYGEHQVLENFCAEIPEGKTTCVMAASGKGKTTLLRILMGLEKPDGGEITGLENKRISAVFQEDRLCESFSPIENVSMCAGRSIKTPRIKWELARLLPEECLNRPVSTLSGGMKRRVAVARALLIPSHILLMDEPFTGMDDELKRNVISYIREKQDGRLLILSTHQEEDVELIGGELVRLENCMDV